MIIQSVPYEKRYSLQEIVYLTSTIRMGLATLNKQADELSRQLSDLEKRLDGGRDVAV